MKIENILPKLTYHVQTGYLNYSEISDIYDLLPQCHYQGKAYRVITNCEEKDFNPSDLKNLYWSKSIDGINYYLSLITRASDELKSYLIVESVVEAIDLNQAFNHLNSLTPDLDPRFNPHQAEEELLAVTANNIKIISFTKI